VTLNFRSSIPPEIWNRLGTKLIPKLRSGSELTAQASFSVTLDRKSMGSFEAALDLGEKIRVEIAGSDFYISTDLTIRCNTLCLPDCPALRDLSQCPRRHGF
jgi:hypothetical protein